MEILYIRESCPFCAVVLKEIDDLGISVECRNISEENHKEVLLLMGGKVQVPYLQDPECGVSMYESDDIVVYLKNKYQQAEDEPVNPDKKVCPT